MPSGFNIELGTEKALLSALAEAGFLQCYRTSERHHKGITETSQRKDEVVKLSIRTNDVRWFGSFKERYRTVLMVL
jgi:hypothetical protein